MNRFRRFLGYAAYVVGGIATFVCISPLFPIGFEALLVGGIFFALGFWALHEDLIRDFFHRIPRFLEARPKSPADPLLPVRILKLAKTRQGILTVSEVAIEMNLPLEDAEAGLQACVRSGSAQEDFDISRGFSLYTFPEFLPGSGLTRE
jgi:hypothetical protein